MPGTQPSLLGHLRGIPEPADDAGQTCRTGVSTMPAGAESADSAAPEVARALALSYESRNPDDGADILAWALLARAAHFAPGAPIPRNLLLATIHPLLNIFTMLGFDERETDEDHPGSFLQGEDGLKRLIALGLLEPETDGSLTLPRMVVPLIHKTIIDGTAQADVEKVVWSEAIRLNNADHPAPPRAWSAHLRAVADNAYTGKLADIDANKRRAGLCHELAVHLDVSGDYAGALSYYERALPIFEKAYGPEHAYTAQCLSNFGYLLHVTGNPVEAYPYCQRALAIREKLFGPDHPDVSLSRNNLGSVLQDMGDWVEARSCYERALAIREKAFGPDHPNTAICLHNLATLCYDEGNVEEAARLMRRALSIFEAKLGPAEPSAQKSRQWLAAFKNESGEGVG